MTTIPDSVVILGAGQAGLSLAATLRAEGYAGEVTLLGEEPDAPYQRPPLSKKYLTGEIGADRLALKPPSFYREQQITLRTDSRAAAIDPVARQITLSDGETLEFGALALTTGAVPRRLPETAGGTLPGVHVLRSRTDVDALAPELAAGRRLLVVGGGYIGLEAAAVATKLGAQVIVLERAERILNRVACAETAAALRALHTSRGVEIREETRLARLEGEGRVSRAVFEDGEILPIDLAVVGIGVVPRTEMAEAAGIVCENGIRVDAACRTSVPGIFAAGDCASFPYEGKRIRLESVQNAIDQGAHAARAILGADTAYAPVPWFWSDQYEARLQIAGLGSGHDRIVTRAGARPGAQSFWYFRGGRFLAVDALSDPKAYMTGKRWLETGQHPDPDRLADPQIGLAAVVQERAHG
ncbi:MAG: NAD(P)/FAD-dependent oxidoreductase [Pikeienuella sp.]